MLTRQVAADTMKGVKKSPALDIIREHFKANSILAKELLLYQTIITEKFDTADKANYLLGAVIKLRNKMDSEKLKQQKYTIIREVKQHYDLVEFFKTNITNYKLYASIYRIFEGANVSKVAEVVRSRYTLIEHLTRKRNTDLKNLVESATEEYLKQDEEVRLLAYKLMLDKFNEKYANLSAKQKSILREYINNVSNNSVLKAFVIEESTTLKTRLSKLISKVDDRITAIKLTEVHNMLGKLQKIKSVKEDHVLSLLLYYELIKELKNVKSKNA